MKNTFDIKLIMGKEIAHYLEVLTQMRVALFKAYPYLYFGNFDYEKKYLEEYLKEQRAVLVLAFDQNKIVGTLTGIPLMSDSSIIADLKVKLKDQGEKPEDYYYYGEMLILPEYRGKGLYLKMYDAIDQHVRNWRYQYTCFLTVVRDQNDPRKPENYKDPYILAEKMGFKKTNTRIIFHWPTIQADRQVKDVNNELLMWVKKL